MAEEACPGCGALFAPIDGPTHRYMESSPACWAAYGEVLAREYEDPELMEVHRMTVDAYAVQHPGKPSPQTIQSVALHLMRLILQLEQDVLGEGANEAMRAWAERKVDFHWLEPPASLGALTVRHVHAAKGRDSHAAAVREWARSALDAWSAHRPQIERWLEAMPAARARK